MSRITDIAIGIVLGAGGIIGAAFAWDKYENSGDNSAGYTPEEDETDNLDTEDIDVDNIDVVDTGEETINGTKAQA